MDLSHSKALRRGRFSEPGRLYLLTTVIQDRAPLLSHFQSARLVVDQFRRAQYEHSARSLAWVIMPDHFHWLVELQDVTLKTLMRRVKSQSARSINRARKRTGKLWQQGFHDRALRREDDIQTVARYIVMNPLRAGLVKRLGDYPHWDAVWL